MIKSLEKHPELIEEIWRSSSGKEFFPADIDTIKQIVDFTDRVVVYIKLKRWLGGIVADENTHLVRHKQFFMGKQVHLNILVYNKKQYYKELWFIVGFGFAYHYPYWVEKNELKFVSEEESKELDMVYLVEAV